MIIKKAFILVALMWMTPLLSPPAFATPLPAQYTVSQGSTLELRYPQEDIKELSGIFDEKPIQFYLVQQEPRFDEVITRAEFLELLFANNTFELVQEATASLFPDVAVDHPAAASIAKAAAIGIISGYEDGTFGPYDPITRGQIAKVLTNAFSPSHEERVVHLFEDVPANHQFYDHIQQAVNAEYFQGYPDGLMRPDRNINFSEAETVIRRASQTKIMQTLGKRWYWRAFLGIHRLTTPGVQQLTLNTLQNGEKKRITIPISILERDFKTVSFSLAPSKTKLFDKDYQDTTWTQINNAKSKTHREPLWDGPFIIPTVGEPTLGFGDKLYINGSYSGSHFGHDWGNTEGTSVQASQNGQVTLAEWTDSYGNTIVIDHGHNVFTMYLHLSEINTKKDQFVQKGTNIGRMGSTGIATGSHLHFTHFIGDIIVDSEEWFFGEW